MIEKDGQTGCIKFNGADGVCTVIYASRVLQAPDAAQFNASAYVSARPVSGQGGRGSAWYVETPAGSAVLKHYRRGGRAALLSEASYLFTGIAHVRSIAEYRVLAALRRLDLPVPEPLAAFCLRSGLAYRAALLTRCIPEARSLAECIREGSAPWEQAGTLIARFHRAGAQHADLNANNILCNADGFHVIDWDKGRLHGQPGIWTGRVLARLQRSITKECPQVAAVARDAGFQRLLAAYGEAMA
ncbi:3-deoxy-D-manno-octulosonic acid kinase [Arenimonas sp. GDDSR-1]|uniref:3-deoxy-D-manno-octulosonic acid kinase n=1 Tax=Arenimonas sp. GDDSR-1 TaxID=2950125 RepID=UPI00261534DD|nr:3-deoxy-D-manno-octulosonic acid kinase [Arenimonas sp. GDDSR-1]